MSNLKLPALDYANLIKLANNGDTWVKIGYQTSVRREPGNFAAVQLRHHDTVIATVTSTHTIVTHGGYHSKTTADRLNRVVYANTGFHIGIKNFELEIRYGHNESMRLPAEQSFYNRDFANA